MIATSRNIRIIGFSLAAVWVLLLLLFWWLIPDGGETAGGGAVRIVLIVATLTPLALIWLAVTVAEEVTRIRDEADLLRNRVAQLADIAAAARPRQAPAAMPAAPLAPSPAKRPVPARRQDPAPAASGQATLQFEAPEPVIITADTLILAVNFPDSADDHHAITALRTAKKDHELARVIRAGQDVITLLAAGGIYMDDLRQQPVPAEVWRRYVRGERGTAIPAIGRATDAQIQEQAGASLRSDEIFRDTAHHFIRHFDRMLSRREPDLNDLQLTSLMETRSARAFILLGRVAGIFGEPPGHG